MKNKKLLTTIMTVPILSLTMLTNSVTASAQPTVFYYILNPAQTRTATPAKVNTTPAKSNTTAQPKANTTQTKSSTTQPKVLSTTVSYEQRVIQLCNAQRARYGVSALSQDNKLMQLCKMKSQDMAYRNYFSHNSPVYGSAFNMMKTYGVRFVAAAENIAEGQKTPDAVVTSWMNSAGHRANILNKLYKQIGVGIATDRYGRLVWTQMFIKAV